MYIAALSRVNAVNFTSSLLVYVRGFQTVGASLLPDESFEARSVHNQVWSQLPVSFRFPRGIRPDYKEGTLMLPSLHRIYAHFNLT